MPKFILPGPDSRTLIVGRTGSGKTVAAIWHLSNTDFNFRPWLVVDYKGDEGLAQIDAIEIQPGDSVPRDPDIYIVRPVPGADDDEMEKTLWSVWATGRTGLYVDEGYMLPNNAKSKAMQGIFTQGRSKHIQVIILSQRPVWLSRFAISESDYYQVFWLNDEQDRKTIERFMKYPIMEKLRPYHSWWYDVKRDEQFELTGVKNPDGSIETINQRLAEIREQRELGKRQRPKVL